MAKRSSSETNVSDPTSKQLCTDVAIQIRIWCSEDEHSVLVVEKDNAPQDLWDVFYEKISTISVDFYDPKIVRALYLLTLFAVFGEEDAVIQNIAENEGVESDGINGSYEGRMLLMQRLVEKEKSDQKYKIKCFVAMEESYGATGGARPCIKWEIAVIL